MSNIKRVAEFTVAYPVMVTLFFRQNKNIVKESK